MLGFNQIQVPIDQLIPEKAYAFFSHTIKAQQDNMDMLDTILQRVIFALLALLTL